MSDVEILAIVAASLTVLNVVGASATWLHSKHVKAVADGVAGHLEPVVSQQATPPTVINNYITVTGITDVPTKYAPVHRQSTVTYHDGPEGVK